MLSEHFLLRHLGRDELRRLAATTIPLSNQPGRCRHLPEGRSRQQHDRRRARPHKICAHSSEGKELILNIIERGGLFGEIALSMANHAPLMRSRSKTPISSRSSDRSFAPFRKSIADLALRLLAVVCKRFRETSEHLEDLLFREAPSRLARCLLRLSRGFGKNVDGGILLDIKLSQQQIGNYVGVSRETVNKQLGEWQRDGLIAISSSIITLRNKAALLRGCSARRGMIPALPSISPTKRALLCRAAHRAGRVSALT